MTHQKPQEPDDPRLAALLRLIDLDQTPPDPAVLAEIGDLAASAFDCASVSAEELAENTHSEANLAGESGPVLLPMTPFPDSVLTPHSSSFLSEQSRLTANTSNHVLPYPAQPRSDNMFALVWKGLAAVSTVAAAILVWIGLAPNPLIAHAPPFARVLEELRTARTLQLRISKKANSADVWVRAPGLVRWQETPQRYQIAVGSRLWKIDEHQNSAIESDSPWFLNPKQQVDLLALMDLGVKDASGLLKATPVERTKKNNRDCLVYRVEVPGLGGKLNVEATADANTLQLMEMIAWGAEGRRRGAPLAELQLVALNRDVEDEKFVVAKSLTEDGRIGKVRRAQGIVLLRPALAARWTPISREMLLKPGDWCRTELRGAHAVKLILASGVELTAGPGTLLECLTPQETRVHSGVVQVVYPKAEQSASEGKFTLFGPRSGNRGLIPGQKQIVRVDRNEKLVDLPQTPVWLAGFEGTSNNESLGSLIVNLPDGRNEPLTVGYHKVSVEIRDQIARTTIEESFVNHTASRLEGIFHFPLPQDASISGFGMWIGNELVEADVVEKQRAREIYETILREKRDPGLLEWTGGNIFKARVFPIEGRSEKRIKIVYTQVLPLRANRYRYSYGLRSEMLQTKPLRELSLSVTVNSALPLKSVSSPTHGVRSQQTQHSAKLEFAAQEYTPNRDFEVVCEVDGKQSEIVVIPHRRGTDGYFMLQLTPPSGEGNWQRELVAEGKPLHVMLLCDTSASMDTEKRKQQTEFVHTILSSLGKEDRFQLAAVDVSPTWAFPQAVAATPEAIQKALSFLESRTSLGWTNLDLAFREAIRRIEPDSQVVYVGDGIVSAGDTDPAAFVQRFGQIVTTDTNGKNSLVKSSIHAVALGSSFESVVLKGIASTGRGSFRAISGELTPQIVAMELLNEVAQPGLKDLSIEFRGIKVAAVYPGKLPNLPAGTQQIVVGRYQPVLAGKGADSKGSENVQSGEVVVTGTRGNEKVKYAARLSFKDAESGNSFIPRLWARSHLEQLLAQGTASLVQDQIIRLSEEFHIITPYTSLLVLETDADRERFGVHRRYEMRDGERFFAEGKDNSNFELVQAQMKLAGDWRMGLRRQVLRSLADLGRNSQQFQQQIEIWNQTSRMRGLGRLSGTHWSYGNGPVSRVSGPIGGPSNELYFRNTEWFGAFGGGLGGGLGGGFGGRGDSSGLEMLDETQWDVDGLSVSKGKSDKQQANRKSESEELLEKDSGPLEPAQTDELLVGLPDGMDAALDSLESLDVDETYMLPGARPQRMYGRFVADAKRNEIHKSQTFTVSRSLSDVFLVSKRLKEAEHSDSRHSYLYGQNLPDYTQWVETIFPPVSKKPTQPNVIPKEPATWSPEAIALAKSLLRVETLRNLEGGLEIGRITHYSDARWNRKSSRSSHLTLYSPKAWLARAINPREQTLISYCNLNECGVYSLAFLLGQSRASVPQDFEVPPLELDDYSISPLYQTYAAYHAIVQPVGEDRVRLVLSTENKTHVEHFTIDTARRVLLKREFFSNDKLNGTSTYDDFVEVAGRWWARKLVMQNAEGKLMQDARTTVQALNREQYALRMETELAARTTVQFLRRPLVSTSLSRQKVADGAATFDHQFAMILHYAQLQNWEEMFKHVESIEKLAADKPGVRWIRTLLLKVVRRNVEARQRFREEVDKLLANKSQDELFLIEFILNQVHDISSWAEYLADVNYAKPIFDRFPNGIPDPELDQEIRDRLAERLAQCFDQLGASEQALAIRQRLAASAPWHLHWQEDYVRRLANAGQYAAAHEWLQKELARPERSADERESLRNVIADLYRRESRWADLLEFTSAWIATNPDSISYNSAYSNHFVALILNDQINRAFEVADSWLKEAREAEQLSDVQRARLEAVFRFAEGNLNTLFFQRMDPRWFQPLADTARAFMKRPDRFDLVQRCVSSHYFTQSDVSDQLRGEWLQLLQSDLTNLNATQLSTYVGWTLSGRMELVQPIGGRRQLDAAEIPDEVWSKIASAIKTRWNNAQEKEEKHILGGTLIAIYAARFKGELLLSFCRERIAAAHPDYRQSYLVHFYEVLLKAPWTSEIEVEAFALLRQLSGQTDVSDRLNTEIPALLRFVDAMVASRIAAGERILHDQGELDRMTRKELAAKKADIRKSARLGVEARLVEEFKQTDGPFANWIQVERLWLMVQGEHDLPQIEATCWKILGDAPPRPDEGEELAEGEGEVTEEQLRQSEAKLTLEYFDAQLKYRALSMLMNLAARSKAAQEGISRLLKYLDAGISHGGDKANSWRVAKYRMLIALDQPEELETQLREWIRADVTTGPWRQSLGRLLAERGKIDEALSLFESCEKDKLLSAADYLLMATWHQVLNHRDAYEKYRITAYKEIPEQNISQMLYQIRNRWHQNINLPSELDESTLFLLRALFEKSAQPESYLWQVKDLYAACRDFRLLQMLPDAILGRSPQQVYGFMQSLQSQVLYELRNEAAADELLSRIRSLRKGKRTPIDLRALDLFEAFVERKSSEVLNQPGPHIEKCLSALRRAFMQQWSEGEPRLMSHFLYTLGGLPQSLLKEEQLQEMRALQKMVAEKSRDHLIMTSEFCNLIFWSYGQKEEALRELEAEIAAYTEANGGLWPHADNEILGRLVAMYEGVGQHRTAEGVIMKYLAASTVDDQRKWLNDRLMSLYNHALEHDGAVSIGTGREKLFAPLVDLGLKELAASRDETARYQLVVRLTSTFEIANRHKLKGTIEAVQKFAFEIVPDLLRRQQVQYRNTATIPMRIITDVLGPRLALQYVVERIEQYPQRLEIQWDNSWNAFGYELAHLREKAGSTDLDDRVLMLALNSLKVDLRTGESRNQYIYTQHHSHFWKEKTADFARSAEEVLNERRLSGRRALVIARYLRHGLPFASRAVEIMFIALKQGLLEEAAQSELVRWLHEMNRHAESIPILEQLVAYRPDSMQYRTELMKSYFVAQRVEQLSELIAKVHSEFHAQGRWTEDNIAQFAQGCFGVEKWQLAINYLTEAIALHQRSNPASGYNDPTLSSYYQTLALAESKLDRTVEAVTAATASIVCWESRHEERNSALSTLNAVLDSSSDLDRYVAHVDAEATRTGQDSPLLRKAIAQIYNSRNDHLKAITQYRLSLELQPYDKECHQALIACYDALMKPQEATQQLLRLIDFDRHDLALFQQLAERLKDNEQEAERAATSIIESAPNESENHTAMAELRQKQNRWAEAIPHWRRVAELRRLEPTGLIKLSSAQIHEKDWAAARQSIEKLQRTEWPSRFSDIGLQTRQLQEQLPK